jgi:hypothetical protein
MPRSARESGRRGSDRKRRRSRCQNSCGGATIDFGARNFFYVPNACVKAYLPPSTGRVLPDGLPFEDVFVQKYRYRFPAPINAISLAVSWNIQEEKENPNDLTRYIISVERDVGCKFVSVVKFQVPVSKVPIDDCTHVERSQFMGVTRPFRVKVCVGDSLFVSVTKTLGENCPVQCGPPVQAESQTHVSNLAAALVSLYLF